MGVPGIPGQLAVRSACSRKEARWRRAFLSAHLCSAVSGGAGERVGSTTQPFRNHGHTDIQTDPVLLWEGGSSLHSVPGFTLEKRKTGRQVLRPGAAVPAEGLLALLAPGSCPGLPLTWEDFPSVLIALVSANEKLCAGFT